MFLKVHQNDKMPKFQIKHFEGKKTIPMPFSFDHRVEEKTKQMKSLLNKSK